MVYVNGALAGHWATGYTGFTVDLDDHLLLRRRQRDPRRLPGARGLPLVLRRRHPPAGAPRRRRRSRTSRSTASGSRRRTSTREFAVVEVATTVEHDGRGMATLDVVTEIRDGDGAVVATATSPVTVLPGEPAVVRQRVLLAEPALWSPDSPALYSATVSLRDGETDGGRRRRLLRRPHAVAGPRAWPADQRRADQAARRVRPLRQRRPRRGDDRPRRGAPGPAAEGGGLQRAAQRAQPDEPGDARRLRPVRRPRHGRADRHVDREQVRLRRGARLPGVVGARRRGDGAQGRQPPERRPLLDRQRDPGGRRARTARSGRGGSPRRCARSTAPGSSPTGSTRCSRVIGEAKRRGAAGAASTRCSPTWARSWTSSAASELVGDADGGVLRRARRGRHELHGGPLRDRPGAVPAPGDRRVGDLPGQDRPAVAARPRQPARHRRLHLDRLGLPRRGRRRPGRRSPTTRPPASSARPTRGCSRTSATSTSPGTAGRRPTTGRSSSGCAATRTSRSCGRSCTAASCRPRRGRGATPSAAGAGPAPRASRSPSRSTATPTRSSCCWTARRSASRRRGRRTGSGPSSR